MWKKPCAFLTVLAALGSGFVACGGNSPTTPTPVPCNYSLSPSSLSLGTSGGSSSVNVATASQCTWTAVSDRGWMSITSGASGTGNGVVNVTLTPNPSEASRTGTLTIASQSVSVQQEGLGACTLEISPSSASYNKDDVTGSFTVTAASHCNWSATSDSPWVAVTSGSPGSGNGTVGYTVERNRDVNARMATITVGARAFTVNQAGDPPAPPPQVCEYSVAPVEFNPCMSVPYSLTATLTTQQGCTWTASSGASWITVMGGQSRTGPGVISFTITDNWDAPRHGVVMVRWPTVTAGQNLQVSQAGCRYAVSTSAMAFAAAGGTGRFDVLQTSEPITCGGATQNACRWTAQADVPWVTVTTAMPQAGDNPVSFSVAVNATTTARTGRITVRDKVVQVTQSGQ